MIALREQAGSVATDWHKRFSEELTSHIGGLAQAAQNFTAESESLTGSVRAIRTSVSVAGRAFSDAEKRLTSSSQRIVSGLDGAVESLEGQVLSLGTRIKLVDVPPDLFLKSVAAAQADVENSMRPIRQLALVTLKDLALSIEQIGNTVRSLPRSAELESAVSGAIAHLTAAANATARLAAETQGVTAALVAVKNEAQGATSSLVRQATEAQAVVREVSQSARQTSDVIKDVVTFVQAELPKR